MTLQTRTSEYIVDGKPYKHYAYYLQEYDMNFEFLNTQKKNGLPYIIHNHNTFINEQDFHDYFAGKIGKPTKEWVRWKRIQEMKKKGV